MSSRKLTKRFRAAIDAATPAIADLAEGAGYATITFHRYNSKFPPSPEAALGLARALDARAELLERHARRLREVAGPEGEGEEANES